MTFNVDPVGASLLSLCMVVAWRIWDSVSKNVESKHRAAMDKLDDYHAENKSRLDELAEEKETDHAKFNVRLDDHGEKIAKLRGDVDVHGYRLSAIEQKRDK